MVAGGDAFARIHHSGPVGLKSHGLRTNAGDACRLDRSAYILDRADPDVWITASPRVVRQLWILWIRSMRPVAIARTAAKKLRRAPIFAAA